MNISQVPLGAILVIKRGQSEEVYLKKKTKKKTNYTVLATYLNLKS